ncbi:unnamed protein product [Ixodes pacificus]
MPFKIYYVLRWHKMCPYFKLNRILYGCQILVPVIRHQYLESIGNDELVEFLHTSVLMFQRYSVNHVKDHMTHQK